ncbi:MAG: two-component sensor histidine kinase [Naasia sp.]|jgi:two-component system sensor histidine kinase SenX3|uniref:sensor histidine kinase n=1 Tax=Naasia sp. TaxID=2546198 RepID=UPI002633CAF7|nr:ATP-binding protein [Naasia sp.]MCU1571773.1 two-component sensor histidine kinase [Naasia sp.]
MLSAWLVPLALLFGLVVGGGITALMIAAIRAGQRAAEAVSKEVPDGIGGVLDALDSAGIVVDPSNTVVKLSPGAAALGLVHQRALLYPSLVAVVDEARASDEPILRNLALPRGLFGDAALLHVSVRAARLGARFVLLLVDDRSDALRLEDVRRDFVANVSHELKTPIGAVSLLSEALDSAADDPDQVRRFAGRLSTEAGRLARITQEIIELSRLQSGDPLDSPDLIDVDHVVASAIDQNSVVAAARDIELVRGGAKHTEVYGDEPLLIVALHNVISNAIQYSPKGSRVGVGVRRNEGLIELSVTDQGVGIAEEDRERVFERFYRVDPARSRHTGGSGLGLSIVKHVVQNHGGEVRLWSQPGRGSTFTLRLPEATPARAAALGLERNP